jgi:hypothetical protein
MKPLKRFTDRIGKTIYRDAVSCGCPTCKDWWEHWIEIYNQAHAYYLEACQWDLWIKYRDTKDNDWLEQLKDLFWFK